MGEEGSDDELVGRARVGDQQAWRDLYQAHAGRLVLWLGTLRTTDVTTSPEDLAADTWLTAARRIADFSGSSDDFAGWLFGIARNLSLNAARRTVRRSTQAHSFDGEDTLILGVADDPTSHVIDSDVVRRLLSRLPRREAEVVACLDVVGFDTATTAEILGISTTAVRVAHHRALTKLRKLMA